ncbi:hypothetical protein RRG08_054756 [Elysia crispata]|uniref:Uncharacterized protein n=1 Tax=Elysia crispata TaxID=231223 RepID=A0AAE1B0U6_9GAST|nr:hypothetical protein RRG08_054756 [Elysia crispata]
MMNHAYLKHLLVISPNLTQELQRGFIPLLIGQLMKEGVKQAQLISPFLDGNGVPKSTGSPPNVPSEQAIRAVLFGPAFPNSCVYPIRKEGVRGEKGCGREREVPFHCFPSRTAMEGREKRTKGKNFRRCLSGELSKYLRAIKEYSSTSNLAFRRIQNKVSGR